MILHAKSLKCPNHSSSVYHKERGSMYKRHIPPLTDKQYDTNLFRWPSQQEYTIQFPRSYAMPDPRDIRAYDTMGQSLSAPPQQPLPKVGAGNTKHVTIQSADSGLGGSLPSSLMMRSKEGTMVTREGTLVKEGTALSGFGGVVRREPVSAV